MRRLEEFGLRIVGHMPAWLRRFLVRLLTPTFSVGAMCVIERADGARLFIRHSYRKGWGVPGGLLKRGEHAVDAGIRETLEEVGIDVVLDDAPAVVIEPGSRRVDVIFHGRPADETRTELSTASPEILEARWFPRDAEVPGLQAETTRALRELDARSEP